MVGSTSYTISGKAPRCLRTNRHEACHCSGPPALLAMHLTRFFTLEQQPRKCYGRSFSSSARDLSRFPIEMVPWLQQKKNFCSACMKWPDSRAACIGRRSGPNNKPLHGALTIASHIWLDFTSLRPVFTTSAGHRCHDVSL